MSPEQLYRYKIVYSGLEAGEGTCHRYNFVKGAALAKS